MVSGRDVLTRDDVSGRGARDAATSRSRPPSRRHQAGHRPPPDTVIRPGEILYGDGDVEFNVGAERLTSRWRSTPATGRFRWAVMCTPQANRALSFDRERPVGSGSTFPPAPRSL